MIGTINWNYVRFINRINISTYILWGTWLIYVDIQIWFNHIVNSKLMNYIYTLKYELVMMDNNIYFLYLFPNAKQIINLIGILKIY